ncbi:MAG: hypothetical protein KIS67_00125 [Verrucomicrobiae bacterium]|nr:hypothetical protein [Verrucomicrobiae bacterium]
MTVQLSASNHPQARASLASALSEGWLKVEHGVPPTPFSLPIPLDAGESAALALAAVTQADVLLMDEKQGRSAARQLGLPVGGLLGELIHARQQGWIPELRSEIRRLREDAGFFVAAELERFLLTQVGE